VTTVRADELVHDDRVHASVYTDPAIVADEMERIVHLGWVFVGHPSEIPNAGAVQATHEMHGWVGRTHRLRVVGGELVRPAAKKVVLVNAAEPLPNSPS
jgi:hypothetical protein